MWLTGFCFFSLAFFIGSAHKCRPPSRSRVSFTDKCESFCLCCRESLLTFIFLYQYTGFSSISQASIGTTVVLEGSFTTFLPSFPFDTQPRRPNGNFFLHCVLLLFCEAYWALSHRSSAYLLGFKNVQSKSLSKLTQVKQLSEFAFSIISREMQARNEFLPFSSKYQMSANHLAALCCTQLSFIAIRVALKCCFAKKCGSCTTRTAAVVSTDWCSSLSMTSSWSWDGWKVIVFLTHKRHERLAHDSFEW